MLRYNIIGKAQLSFFRLGFRTTRLLGTLRVREALNKLIPLMVRQAHHERNQLLTVRPEPVEGLILRFLRDLPGFKNLEGLHLHDTQLTLGKGLSE